MLYFLLISNVFVTLQYSTCVFFVISFGDESPEANNNEGAVL